MRQARSRIVREMEPHSTHDRSVPVVAAVIHHDGKVLLTRRFHDAHLGGLWEFPGGKVEKGESMETALIREIREELGVRISVGSLILEERFDYGDRTVHLHFFDCRIVEGSPRSVGVADLSWVFPSELGQHDMPKANARLVARLQKGFF